MNNGTASNISANLIIVAFGTSVLSPVQYGQCLDSVPTYTAQYQRLPSNSWEDIPEMMNVVNEIKFDSLKSFTENLLKNTKDIETDILEVVNKNFWNLI